MIKPIWVEINRDSQAITTAMNTPAGVLMRVYYTFEISKFELQFIPGIKAVKADTGDYILCHG